MAYVCEDGSTRNVDVTWDTKDEALARPGLHHVVGFPATDENTSLAEGFDGMVTWPVYRKGGGPIEAIPLQKPFLSDPRIPLEGDASALLDILTRRTWAVGPDGTIKSDDTWVWEWDYSGVDTSKEGEYTVTGSLVQTPEWITVAEENRTAAFAVYVLPTDRIEIFAAVKTSRLVTTSGSLNVLEIKWLYDSANVTEAALQRMDGSGQWIDCDSSWYDYSAPGRFSEANLRLILSHIPPGTQHTLRLRYPDVIDGEVVDRLTAPIRLTVPENIDELLLAASGGIPEGLDIEGDRDGGDSEGADMPDYELPVPDSEPEPEPVLEVVTDTYTAISGLRVNLLASMDSAVLFEKQGAAAEIPAVILRDLELRDNELLEVTLLRPQEDAVQLAVYAAGKPVEDLSGTVIYLPWNDADGSALVCQDWMGNGGSEVFYEESTGTVRFEISTPGIYFLIAQPQVPKGTDIPEEPAEAVLEEVLPSSPREQMPPEPVSTLQEQPPVQLSAAAEQEPAPPEPLQEPPAEFPDQQDAPDTSSTQMYPEPPQAEGDETVKAATQDVPASKPGYTGGLVLGAVLLAAVLVWRRWRRE